MLNLPRHVTHAIVVGDVAILNSLPVGDEEMQRRVGELIMSRNKAIKVMLSS